MLNVEDPSVTVKCRMAIKVQLLYLNLGPGVKFVCLFDGV